jgi:calcineurin-like phosphoesterase family protein
MIRFWTADQHYNHANLVAYARRPQLKPGDRILDPVTGKEKWVSPEIAFERAEAMNKMLIREHNMRVKETDSVVHVGDFSCKGGERGVRGLHIPPAEIMAGLKGRHIIVAGNHDDQNSVKTDCDFMSIEIGKYRAGVQHRPLFDPAKPMMDRGRPDDNAPWRVAQMERERKWLTIHTEYCQKAFDLMLVGHVHQAWKTRLIAGIWHINVGVDVNRYMPINDQEVIQIYEKAKRDYESKGEK